MPFCRTVREAGRIIVENPLVYRNGRYEMNLEELESLVTPTCRTLILCSPHNPVSRVWSREELEALADIVRRKDMIVIADEIHQDLVYSDAKHTCLGSLPGMDKHVLTFIAPSKTFNIAGLKSSVAIIPDERLRGVYVSVLERFHPTSTRSTSSASPRWRPPTASAANGTASSWPTSRRTATSRSSS